jgi:hypothetical protein
MLINLISIVNVKFNKYPISGYRVFTRGMAKKYTRMCGEDNERILIIFLLCMRLKLRGKLI